MMSGELYQLKAPISFKAPTNIVTPNDESIILEQEGKLVNHGVPMDGIGQINNEASIKQADHQIIAFESNDLVGSAGKEVWKLNALKNGTTALVLEYSRPWEGGEKAV